MLFSVSSASAMQDMSFVDSRNASIQACSLDSSSQAQISSPYSAYNEWRILIAIKKVKQFARNFRRGFFDYLDYYCDRLEKNYRLSCTLEIL